MDRGPRTVTCFLTDFGLAKSVGTGSRLTRTGEALGTPAYMSPEQARGEVSSLTPATDVWSLGCVFYEMLAGRPAFEGDSAAAVIARVLLQEPVRLRKLRSDAPEPLERLLRAALLREARSRIPSASEFRDDLDRLLLGQRPRARLPRPRAALWALAASGLALVAWGALALPPKRAVEAPSPPAGDREAPGTAFAEKARSLRHSDPREAAALLDIALGTAPARHDWRLERGLLLWAVGDGPAAREEWERIPPESRLHSEARLFLGLEAFFRLEEGGLQGEKGRTDLSAAARDSGPTGVLARGALHALDDDWGRARDVLATVGSWQASLLRGYVEMGDPKGDAGSGVAALTAGLEGGITFAWALYDRGVLRLRQGDMPAAEVDFDAALGLRPRYPKALVNRGAARADLGDPARAIADYDEALRLQPGMREALFNRGNAWRLLGEHARAAEDYGEVLRRWPRDWSALVGRAAVLRRLGDFAGALSDYDAALEIRSPDAETLDIRGNVKQAMGDYAGAIADHDAALRLRPDFAAAYRNRGIARGILGDPSGAAEDFQAAIRLDPRDPEARKGLGISRRKLGDPRGALDEFREFLRLAPAGARTEDVRRWMTECEAEIVRGAGQDPPRR